MHSQCSADDPPKPISRPSAAPATFDLERLSPNDTSWWSTLRGWQLTISTLRRGAVSTSTRVRLGDAERICDELLRVLQGAEPGEGRARDRVLFEVRGRDVVQALATMFACPGGTFIELIVTAPWNLLGEADPVDSRTIRGAGSALIRHAVSWSRLRGCGGRIALQAENPRTLAFYERAGFRRMQPEDDPLELVPPGDLNWSPEILRLAHRIPDPGGERSPWLVLDGGRSDAEWLAHSAA